MYNIQKKIDTTCKKMKKAKKTIQKITSPPYSQHIVSTTIPAPFLDVPSKIPRIQ
jgi:hypothetical protein